MLVRTKNIPDEGLDLSFLIPARDFTSALRGHEDLTEMFDNAVSCSLHLQRNDRDILLTGEADTEIKPVCARCGERFHSSLTASLLMTCVPEVGAASRSGCEDDESVVRFSRDEIDLAVIVREQLLLSLPIKHLCSESCRGLCPQCGVNMNRGDHVCAKSAG